MFEKVNPSHPDKVADRIAGAIVDLSYSKQKDPKVAVEVLIGHGKCHIINETSCKLDEGDVRGIVRRIAGESIVVDYAEVPQDKSLSKNQSDGFRCGDNGIFKGSPITEEQRKLTEIAKEIYSAYPYDGKYIINGDELVICQSNAKKEDLGESHPDAFVNPLGDWTGGPDADSGATNRKLGSDMGGGAAGGGLHGKDLSKADATLNILCHIFAQQLNREVRCSCAIGDALIHLEYGDGKILASLPYYAAVDIARAYVESLGGFEKLAEWGLIRQ